MAFDGGNVIGRVFYIGVKAKMSFGVISFE